MCHGSVLPHVSGIAISTPGGNRRFLGGVSVTARDCGTSQSGQTVNSTLIVDCSKYLDHVLELRHPEALAPLSASLEGRGQALRGRARHRARRSQSSLQAARLVISGRHLDRLARHHRRHGRQQFLRCALAALRQHPRERALDRRDHGRRHERTLRPGRARPLRPAHEFAGQAAGA
jgi:hypothetical protein